MENPIFHGKLTMVSGEHFPLNQSIDHLKPASFQGALKNCPDVLQQNSNVLLLSRQA